MSVLRTIGAPAPNPRSTARPSPLDPSMSHRTPSSQWRTTHDSAGIVLLHLLASGATLLGVSAAMGWLTRRVSALRPAGA